MGERRKRPTKKETEEKAPKIVEEKIRGYHKGDEAWYKKTNDIVKKSYIDVTAPAIIEACKDTKRLPYAEVDPTCTYNDGDRTDKKELELKIVEAIDNYIAYTDLPKEGRTRLPMEERMCHVLYVQHDVGDFIVRDYQIPTTNGEKDGIDLLLTKGDIFYMTEVKKFSPIAKKFGKEPSDETLLRCVLEIQTYYQKLNNYFFTKYGIKDKTKLKKAILLDKEMEAYKELNRPWADKILQLFDITVLELDREGTKFKIKEIFNPD